MGAIHLQVKYELFVTFLLNYSLVRAQHSFHPGKSNQIRRRSNIVCFFGKLAFLLLHKKAPSQSKRHMWPEKTNTQQSGSHSWTFTSESFVRWRWGERGGGRWKGSRAVSAPHRWALMDALCTPPRPHLSTTCLFGCWSHPSVFVPNCPLTQRYITGPTHRCVPRTFLSCHLVEAALNFLNKTTEVSFDFFSPKHAAVLLSPYSRPSAQSRVT